MFDIENDFLCNLWHKGFFIRAWRRAKLQGTNQSSFYCVFPTEKGLNFGSVTPGVDFINILQRSFYLQRSHIRKKDNQVTSDLNLWPAHVKAARKMLMKLTQKVPTLLKKSRITTPLLVKKLLPEWALQKLCRQQQSLTKSAFLVKSIRIKQQCFSTMNFVLLNAWS